MSLELLTAGLSFIGGSKKSSGEKETGRREAERGREQKIYNEVAATQVEAIGQLGAFEEARQAELMASRAIAVAAAGGYSADIDHLIADIHGEGAYRASIVMYEAESEAERLRFEGRQAEEFGVDQLDAAKDKAKGTRINTLASLFSAAGNF